MHTVQLGCTHICVVFMLHISLWYPVFANKAISEMCSIRSTTNSAWRGNNLCACGSFLIMGNVGSCESSFKFCVSHVSVHFIFIFIAQNAGRSTLPPPPTRNILMWGSFKGYRKLESLMGFKVRRYQNHCRFSTFVPVHIPIQSTCTYKCTYTNTHTYAEIIHMAIKEIQ